MKRHVRKVVARNVRALMKMHSIKQGQFQERGGPSQKTMSNVLNEDSANSPTLETLGLIARILKVEAWQLLVPRLDDNLRSHRHLRELVDNYLYATPEGKMHIQTVAEREYQYTIVDERKVAEQSPSYKDDDCSCANGEVF